jgi:hypothetical protein
VKLEVWPRVVQFSCAFIGVIENALSLRAGGVSDRNVRPTRSDHLDCIDKVHGIKLHEQNV